MELIKISILLISLVIFQSCQTNKSTIFWVSGLKTDCTDGAGQMKCLIVHRGEGINKPKWENFYTTIKGFEFEEGFLKKIKVKEEKLKAPPVDASSIKYTMIKELEKQVDYGVLVDGQWILAQMDDKPINRSVKLPEMEIKFSQMQVSGTGGCNNYSGKINKLTSNTIQFGKLLNTQKACANKNIEQEYLEALNTVNAYQITGGNLIFYNKTGEKVLSFIKKVEVTANPRLHDIWAAIRISGNPINRMVAVPRMEIHLKDMKVMGYDGCNEYTGEIKEISESKLVFGKMASTKKMCPNKDVVDMFNAAMDKVAMYKMGGLNLMLLDANGKELLVFLKVD